MSRDLEQLRDKVAIACRILAREGLVDGILGHVSARVDDGRMLVRCRGPEEHGLAFTTAADVRMIDFAGYGAELSGGYEPPKELPIHAETYRLRSEVRSVVHAHPRSSLLCGLAGLQVRPVFGAFNIPAMRMAIDGVPVFPRSILITRADLAAEMLVAMQGRSVCVLRGHGITVTGQSVEQATVRAVDLNVLLDVTLQLAQLRVEPVDIPRGDLAELPDLGSAFNVRLTWNSLAAKLDGHMAGGSGRSNQGGCKGPLGVILEAKAPAHGRTQRVESEARLETFGDMPSN